LDALIKGDKDLEGMKKEDIDERKEFTQNCLVKDDLWDNTPDSGHLSDGFEDDVKFYTSKLDNASENDIKNVIGIIEDRFQMENKESLIAKAHIEKSSQSLITPEIQYGNMECDEDE
jgi:hypothetical protein